MDLAVNGPLKAAIGRKRTQTLFLRLFSGMEDLTLETSRGE